MSLSSHRMLHKFSDDKPSCSHGIYHFYPRRSYGYVRIQNAMVPHNDVDTKIRSNKPKTPKFHPPIRKDLSNSSQNAARYDVRNG